MLTYLQAIPLSEKTGLTRDMLLAIFQKSWKNNFLGVSLFLLLSVCASLVSAKRIDLELNDAQIIRFDGDVSEIFIANPDIADVQLTNPHSAYVYGKAPGTTKLFAVNAKGKEILQAQIYVTYDISQLKEMIAPFDPYDLVEVRSIPGAIVLEGQVDSPKTAEEIRSIAEKFVTKTVGASNASTGGSSTSGSTSSGGGAADKSKGKGKSAEQTIINRLSIKSPVQVSLRVKFAEVSRTVFNSLGINWQAVFSNIGHFNFAAITGRNPITALPIATNNVTTLVPDPNTIRGVNGTLSSLGANFTNSHVNLNEVIDLLSEDGLVTILAEPNLMAISGETASFLAGGEFPYPIPQQFGNVTIDFKQYGVSLAFTPTVLNGRMISMRVRPEVSELDYNNGLVFQGFEIPGIASQLPVAVANGSTSEKSQTIEIVWRPNMC